MGKGGQRKRFRVVAALHLHRQLVERGRREARYPAGVDALTVGVRVQRTELLLEHSLSRGVLLRLPAVAIGVAALAQGGVDADDRGDRSVERLSCVTAV